MIRNVTDSFNANKRNIKLVIMLFIVSTSTECHLGLADIAMHCHLLLIIAQAQFVLYRN